VVHELRGAMKKCLGKHIALLLRSGGSFLGAESAAVRAVSTDLGADEGDFKSEMRFHLLAHFPKRLAEILFDFAAAEADDMCVFLLEARFVIMLIAGVVHEVELVDEAAFFKEFERSIDGDAVELGVLFLGELVEALGIEVEAGVVDQVEQDASLASQPDATLAKGILNAGVGHGWFQGSKKK
jgi:hypothetical protein